MKIGIMGPFGFGNLGDAAIQQAMLDNIRKTYPDAQIVGFSLNPEDTSLRHAIQSYPIGRMAKDGWIENGEAGGLAYQIQAAYNKINQHPLQPIRILGKLLMAPIQEAWGILHASRHLAGMNYLFASGGGQLDDFWGGPWHHPYTLFLWGMLSRLRQVKYNFVSVGAGPLKAGASKRFARWALALASYRSYRDQDSKDYLRKIGFRSHQDPIYPDLAFSLDISPYPTDRRIGAGERLVVGIGPIIYYRPGNWPEQDPKIYAAYLEKLACFIAWLIQNHHQVLFFPGDYVHDRLTINDLKQVLDQMGVRPGDGQIIDEPVETVAQLMRQLAKTDVVVASRFHGMLLSILINKPVIALSYHPKMVELMKDTGQSDYCFSIDRFTEIELQQAFAKIIANNPSIKQQLAKRVDAYRKELDEQYQQIFSL